MPWLMTTNAARNRAPNDNPFESLWAAMETQDGPAAERVCRRIEREYRHIERRVLKRVA